MTVPLTPTICSTVAQPCPPGEGAPCPTTGAAIATDNVIVVLPVENEIGFDVDVFENPPDGSITNADSANNQIVIGADAVYTVTFTATYAALPGETITIRIKVNGITAVTLVHALGAVVTQVAEVRNIALNDGDLLTATAQTSSLEGAVITFASLAAIRNCGPSTDVIVPQG